MNNIKPPTRSFWLAYFITLSLIFILPLSSGFFFLPSLTWKDLDRINYDESIHSPPDNNWYLASDFKGNLDYDVIYYNFGKSIENANKADIIILGNSRILSAFDESILKYYGNHYGLKFFNMGFGHIESYKFPYTIIKKYDLRPKIVIINAEDFRDDFSNIAMHVISQGKPRRALSFFVRSSIYKDILIFHSYSPKWIQPILEKLLRKNIYNKITYRSRITGALLIPPISRKSIPIINRYENNCDVEVKALDIAKRFKDEMLQRGTQIVITLPPHNNSCRKAAEKIAEYIGVPLIYVDWRGLNTFDGSHLTVESGQRFTEEFLKKFENSETFLNAISKKPKKLN